jgi:ribosomal protein S18 acetylase RimI-like enzyme
VDEDYRRRGIARRLLERLRVEAGPMPAFVLAEPGNAAANALYAALGGEPESQTIWRFD